MSKVTLTQRHCRVDNGKTTSFDCAKNRIGNKTSIGLHIVRFERVFGTMVNGFTKIYTLCDVSPPGSLWPSARVAGFREKQL